MTKTVIMFAGQGSQYKNMGLDFLENSIEASELYSKALKILNYDIKEIINSDLINDTKYTQSLVFLTSAMIYAEVKKILKPNALLGFSLGEYTAYYANEVFSFEDTLEIVKNRSLFMADAANNNPGSMAAIIGLNKATLQEICSSLDNCYVTIANYNEPNQLVISGLKACVEKVSELALEKDARRAIPLNVSGAFHSQLMIDAGEELEKYLKVQAFNFNKPKYPMWLNVTGKENEDEDLIEIMKKQVYSPVLFHQSIENLINNGYNNFIEIGPGKVLTGLVKKINRDVNVINISNYVDLEKLKELF